MINTGRFEVFLLLYYKKNNVIDILSAVVKKV